MDNTILRGNFEAEMQNMTQQNLCTLYTLWDQMGCADSSERMSAAKGHIEKSFKEMIAEEKGHLDSLLKEIQVLDQEKQNLLRELGHDTANEDEYADVPYIQIVNDLRQRVENLRSQKEERMVEVNALRDSDEKTSAAIGMPAYPLDPKMLPTVQQMNELAQHIEEMKDLKITRLQQFELAKSQIIELYEELGSEPNTTMERRLICELEEGIILSSANMSFVEKMLSTLQGKLDANKEAINNMLKRIEFLCNRLNLDEQKHSQYMKPTHIGYSEPVLKEISSRLEELEKFKLKYLSQFVEDARREILYLWDCCYYGDTQRNAFIQFHSTDLDEQVLDEHEKEVARLKKYLEKNSRFFDKLKEWEQLWTKKVELDNKQNDPDRLFNKRKNNLIQEESERKSVKRQLPKMEKELFEMVATYEAENATPCIIFGLPFEEFMHERKLDHREDAKLEKDQKKNLKRRMVENEAAFGASKLPLTPANNMTSSLLKNRRLESSSKGSAARETAVRKLDFAGMPRQPTSTKRAKTQAGTPRKTGVIQTGQKIPFPSKKLGGYQTDSHAKRMKMNENSIISGNLQNTIQSVDSSTSYKDHDLVASTFTTQSKWVPRRFNLRQPSTLPDNFVGKASGIPKSFTPLGSNFKTPEGTTFKTPSSRPNTASAKQRAARQAALRSGRKVPFKL